MDINKHILTADDDDKGSTLLFLLKDKSNVEAHTTVGAISFVSKASLGEREGGRM